jgi:hypothetical protein
MSEDPIELLLVQLDSFSNIIEEEFQGLALRPITETYMGSTKPLFSDAYRTHVHPTDTVDPHQTLAHSVWRNPSGHDLYENFEYIRQPLNPHHPPTIEAGPSGQTIDHPIEQVIYPIVMSAQLHFDTGVITSTHSQGTSTITPTFTPLHTTSPHGPQDPVGTPLYQRM